MVASEFSESGESLLGSEDDTRLLSHKHVPIVKPLVIIAIQGVYCLIYFIMTCMPPKPKDDYDQMLLKCSLQLPLLLLHGIAYIIVSMEQKKIRLAGYIALDGRIQLYKHVEHWCVIIGMGLVLLMCVIYSQRNADEENDTYEIILIVIVLLQLIGVMGCEGLSIWSIIRHNKEGKGPDAVSYLGKTGMQTDGIQGGEGSEDENLRESQAAMIRLLRKQNEQLAAQLLRLQGQEDLTGQKFGAISSGIGAALSDTPESAQLRADISQMREELTRAKATESRLQSQIHSLRAASSSSSQEVRELKRQLDMYREQCDKLRIQLHSEQKIAHDLNMAMQAAEDEESLIPIVSQQTTTAEPVHDGFSSPESSSKDDQEESDHPSTPQKTSEKEPDSNSGENDENDENEVGGDDLNNGVEKIDDAE